MHATETPVAVHVCYDCLAILANGTLGAEDEVEDQAHADKMDAAWPNTEVTLGWTEEQYISEGIDPEDDKAGNRGFSWGQCDGCGSTLGGDRYAATAWVAD